MERELIMTDGDREYLPDTVVRIIIDMEKDLKAMKEAEQAMREKLLAEMEAVGMVGYSTNDGTLKIAYIPEGDRESFDTKAFRDDFPELYDKYVKIGKVHPQIKITVR